MSTPPRCLVPDRKPDVVVLLADRSGSAQPAEVRLDHEYLRAGRQMSSHTGAIRPGGHDVEMHEWGAVLQRDVADPRADLERARERVRAVLLAVLVEVA